MTGHIGGLTDEDLRNLPPGYSYGYSEDGWAAECRQCRQQSEPGSNEAMHAWAARHEEYRLCPVAHAEPPWTLEFPADSISHAGDLCRQAARPGGFRLIPDPGGRLGYQATGTREQIRRLADLVGKTTYQTRHG